MAGIYDGIWGGPSGVLPSGAEDFQYPTPVYEKAQAAAMSPPPPAPVPYQNYSPAAPQMTAQPSMGFMDRLESGLSSPLTQFGLGLASGRTPQEGIGNALQSVQFRQKLEHEKMTAAIKEYQYAISTGGLPPGTTFPEFLQIQHNATNKFANQPTYFQYKDENGEVKIGMGQTNSGGGFQELNAPRGGSWAPPNMTVQTPTGTVVAPKVGTPNLGGLPGSAPGAPPGIPGATQSGTTTYIPKDLIGAAEGTGIGQDNAKDYAGIRKDAEGAIRMKSSLSRMSQLNDEAYQGAAAPGLQHARSLLATFGVDPGKVPAGEEMTALSSKMTMDALNGSLGVGISSTDRDYIAGQNPTIANTREGRTRMIDTATKIADRKIETLKMASDYRAKHGNMVGFTQELAKYSDEHPMFPKQENQGSGRPTKTINGKTYIKQNGQWYEQ